MSKFFKMKGVEEDDGVINLYDERVVLFPPNIITLLGSVFGKGSKSLLVYLGKKMGRRLAENWEEHLRPQNLQELTQIFFEKTSIAGWGEFKVESMSENEILTTLRNNIAHSEEQPLRHVCDFLTGYLAGFGEFAMYNAKVIEEKCSVDDPSIDFCQFRIIKR